MGADVAFADERGESDPKGLLLGGFPTVMHGDGQVGQWGDGNVETFLGADESKVAEKSAVGRSERVRARSVNRVRQKR